MIQIEQLERRVLADRQAVIAAGAREGLPTLPAAQQEFDEWLNGEPGQQAPITPADLQELELRTALGVA